METNLSEFAAREPSLGYFYQIRYGLLLLLSNRDLYNPTLRIENLDDIELQDLGQQKLFQTKHKLKSKANLSNSSVDFWKTIRVWSNNIRKGRVDVNSTIFTLITTETVPESSVLFTLTKKQKSIEQIVDLINELDNVTTSSTNEANKKAYAEYLKLTVDQKEVLFSNVYIIDAALNITEITNKIKAELALSSYPDHIEAFLEILEGWWFQNSIKQLLGYSKGIIYQELQMKVSDIRDSFSQNNLPNHYQEQLEISDQEANDFRNKTYLKQLEIIRIDISSNTAKRAISDFRRAFEQRSKWLRLDLLNPDEQNAYDQRLYDYWRNLFDILKDECIDQATDKLKEIGKNFYLNQFIKQCPQIRIRERFNEDYLTRGSFQILSDQKRVGWHPNYKTIIE